MRDLSVPTVRQLLDCAADKYADKTFIRFVRDGKIIEKSYLKVNHDSKAVCRWIRNISKDKMHIAIISKTGYEYITCLTGILISGNVAVPFAPEISVKEATDLFCRADIDMILFENEFADKADVIKKNCPCIKYSYNIGDTETFERIYAEFSDSSPYADLSETEVDENDCALIIFTSGTTGVRKGVMLSTKALVANTMSDEIKYDDNDISLSVLPMYHIFCFSGDYIKNLRTGVGLCLNGDIRDIITNLGLFRPGMMRVVPMIAQSLLQRVKFLISRKKLDAETAKNAVFGENMKWIFSGGAYLSPELAQEYEKLGIYLRQGYGMTEAGCRISVPDEGVSTESVGRIIDICDARIENGEIQVKTPSVMLGYYKMPDETAKMFTEDGWLKTGDLGYISEDNQLYITGRVKNLIILSSGENVSPEAIEKKFSAYPLISEVVVYGENNNIAAEVYPDFEYAASNGISDIKGSIEKAVDEMNKKAKPSHIIAQVKISDSPLEKTSTGKIKRKNSEI